MREGRSEVAVRLGALELSVMQHVWTEGPLDVKAVHRALGVKRGISLNTVQSTMERLHRKGLLDREKVRHAYVYAARLSREEYGSRAVEDVLSGLMAGDTEPMMSAFVDFAARTGEESLARLERLIHERRATGSRKL
jgi:predicted transcriptional regulator